MRLGIKTADAPAFYQFFTTALGLLSCNNCIRQPESLQSFVTFFLSLQISNSLKYHPQIYRKLGFQLTLVKSKVSYFYPPFMVVQVLNKHWVSFNKKKHHKSQQKNKKPVKKYILPDMGSIIHSCIIYNIYVEYVKFRMFYT